MISASKTTFGLENFEILRPKVTKNLQFALRSFVNPHPDIYIESHLVKDEFKMMDFCI